MNRSRDRSEAAKVLVACLGNADRGDDGLGMTVAHQLSGRLPAGAALLVRSGDMLALIDDWAGFDTVICVDAAAPVGMPGRIHRIDLTTGELPQTISLTSSHAFGLAEAIRLARMLRQAPQRIIVYAIEGCCFDSGAPLTNAVSAAADEVARRVRAEIGEILKRVPESVPHA